MFYSCHLAHWERSYRLRLALARPHNPINNVIAQWQNLEKGLEPALLPLKYHKVFNLIIMPKPYVYILLYIQYVPCKWVIPMGLFQSLSMWENPKWPLFSCLQLQFSVTGVLKCWHQYHDVLLWCNIILFTYWIIRHFTGIITVDMWD